MVKRQLCLIKQYAITNTEELTILFKYWYEKFFVFLVTV